MSTATLAPPFTMKAGGGDGGDFELPPSGTHPAVLVGLIDLGTHGDTFNGTPRNRRTIALVWELTAEMDSKGRPFVIGEIYTSSLGAKANLRTTVVDGYRGRKLADGEEFDIMTLVGQPCQVTLQEGTTKAGKPFVSVGAVGKPMRGLTVPDPSREAFVFHFDMVGSSHDFPAFPDWLPRIYGKVLADEAKSSKEYAKLSPF